MEHDEVRELLEDAAVEPGGLERLMAGDTPTAALVAGHLAGCPSCTEELDRLRRSVGVIRPAVRAVPPPELRRQTLDFVAAVGRPRGADGPPAPPLTMPAAAPAPRSRVPVRTLGAMAAVLVFAVVGTAVAVNAGRDAALRGQAAEIEALGDVARWTFRVDRQPDAERVDLASSSGDSTTGTLLYSPASREVVVVADHLAPAPAGHEYRCWVEVNGQRVPIGKMFFGGDLAYWVGDVPQVATLDDPATFGVSLVDLASPTTTGQEVLVGES
ncbi:MAG TPA: anti-sigma factor [Candidatus Limnocylindrales bacterium]